MKGISQTIDTPNKPSISGKPIYFYYRFENNDFPNIFSDFYKNTLWIDANNLTNLQITATNVFNLDLSGSLIGGKNTNIKYSNTFINGELTINAVTPSLTISSSNNIYIYLRVGLPMSVDINFTHITCSLLL